MKKLILFIVTLLLSQNIKLYAQELEYGFVEYVDSINSYSNLKIAKQIKRENNPNRENQNGVLYSRLGKFEVTYEDNYFMTDGVKHCLKMALDTWEDKLTINNPIKFHVCISEELPEEIAIKTRVGYSRKTFSSSVPDNLGRQENINISSHDTITINALLDWNASWPYDDTYTGNINMTVGFLRHITHILGFGTSLVKKIDNIGFSIIKGPSQFDKLLYNGEKYLSDLRNANQQQIRDFFKHPLHLHSESFDYKLYDSDSFLDHKSGNYFSLGFDNIMEYPWNNKEKLLDINQETINVIQAIGWETASHNAKINSANTDILGYGSFYNEQIFTLQKDGITMSPQTWTCKILNPQDKLYEITNTSAGNNFKISPMLNAQYLDEYSCLNYRIECSLDGFTYTFPLYLDTHPLIENIEITNIEKTDNRHYRYLLNIKQKGAKGGNILVTDDTGTSIEYRFDGKPIQVESLVYGYTSYIDVTLYNDYGSTSRFVILNNYTTNAKNNTTKAKIYYSVNGIANQNILKDNDVLSASLKNLDESVQIKDIMWGLCFKTPAGRTVYEEISNTKKCNISITPEIFRKKYCFLKDKTNWYSQSYTYRDKIAINPDSCILYCKLSYYKSGKEYQQVFTTDNIVFDVLPTEPKIEFLKFTEDPEGDSNNPIITTRFSTKNNEEGFVWVYPSGVIEEYVFCDAIFHSNDTIYDVFTTCWNDKICCEAFNKYGSYYSNWIKITPPTDIQSIKAQEYKISTKNSCIEITGDKNFNLDIYSISGNLIVSRSNITYYIADFPKGVYIVRIRDKNNKQITKKIYVQ